jgi:hypothetical protein
VKGPWFPRVLGVLAAALAAVYSLSCLTTDLPRGEQVVLGSLVTGPWGWVATLVHALFFVWLARACFTRLKVAPWAWIGTSVYMIQNIWIYTLGEGSHLFPRTMQLMITNSLLTAALLSFCRVVLNRRAEFDR